MPASLIPCVAGLNGPLYAAGARFLGAVYVRRARDFGRATGAPDAMALFRWSITYLSVLFALMLVDRWLAVLFSG